MTNSIYQAEHQSDIHSLLPEYLTDKSIDKRQTLAGLSANEFYVKLSIDYSISYPQQGIAYPHIEQYGISKTDNAPFPPH